MPDKRSTLIADPGQFWLIHGKYYDIEPFLKKHPGGFIPLEIARGRDCTELFESYHGLTDRPATMLRRFLVKDLEPTTTSDTFDWDSTPIYDSLKARVRAYFKEKGKHSHKAPITSMILVGAWLLLTALSALAWITGQWFSVVTLPIFYWLGASQLMHSGNHFAFSKNPFINAFAGFLGGLHIASWTWLCQHVVGHHAYTNIPGKDPDLNHFQHPDVKVPGFRLHPNQPWMKKYRFHLFGRVFLSMLTTLGPSLLSEPFYLKEGNFLGAVPLLFKNKMALFRHIAGRVLIALFCFGYPIMAFGLIKGLAFGFT